MTLSPAATEWRWFASLAGPILTPAMHETLSSPPVNPGPSPAPPRKQGRGCLWAAIISFVLMLVLAVVGVFVVRGFVRSAISTYTSTEPVPIPILETTEAEAKEISDRARQFFEDLQAGEPVEPLVLTAEDLNRLIAWTGTNQLAGKLYVAIEDGEVRGRMSFPLDQTGWNSLQGRYLNADVVLTATLSGGELVVRATDIRANDKSVPAFVLKDLKQRNLADQFMNNPDAFAAMQLLESITVTDEGIMLTPRP